jgi:hypothetical protein
MMEKCELSNRYLPFPKLRIEAHLHLSVNTEMDDPNVLHGISTEKI